ncbi:thioredoxin [bacterium]|nr:thioredoxin [bacterium]
MADESSWIYDVGIEQFEPDVIERSMAATVIVDFWAPWCQPCRALGPLLEQIVKESGGRVLLAKINVDENQELAGMMRVQSIPTVVAFVEGQPVDHFMGVLPEDQLREWVSRLLPSRAEELVNEALAIEVTEPAKAEQKLREALTLEAQDATKIHLARVLLAQGRDEECSTVIAELDARGFLEPEAQAIRTQLELRVTAEESGGVQAARAAAEANPDDLSLQIHLADALAVDGKYRDAFDILLTVVEKNLGGEHGNTAKKQMVDLFGVLGEASPLVGEYRRKLATLLY